MKPNLLSRALNRARYIRTSDPYERFLRSISQRGDARVVSQGEFIQWWQQRASSNLEIVLCNGMCDITTNLSSAVIEVFPNDFHPFPKLTTHFPNCDFNGLVLLTIDENLRQKELFKEALRREGILNYTEGASGEFFFSTEVSPILEDMASSLKRSDLECFHQCINNIRQLIIERLRKRRLPLIRIWYHPHIDGKIIHVVISPRYDVERALTNMPRIWELERKYRASSTAHIRSYCPFYSDERIREVIRHPACTEVALHGEFVGNAHRFGGLLEAAVAEKKKLEELTGHQAIGASLHGGELISNGTQEAQEVISKVGFLYTTSIGPASYYFPYRLLRDDETFDITYHMSTNFGDIRIPYSPRYAEDFHSEVIQQVDLAAEQGGILVMMLHPTYFNFVAYLLDFTNLVMFCRFMPTYFVRLLRRGWQITSLKPKRSIRPDTD